jgi:hypothetical protein
MSRLKNILFGFGIAAALLLGSVSVAHAQYGAPPPGYGYPPPALPPRGMYREGLVVGVGLGGGVISASNCGACGGGLAGELHIGGMINPQLALMADLWFLEHQYDDLAGGSNTLTNSMFTAALQYWAMDKLWLKGGLGGARITLSDAVGNSYGSSEGALGVLLAGGFEVVQAGSFALDLQLRFGYGAYSGGGASNFAFLVGANWY